MNGGDKYKQAGVNVDAGNLFAEMIRERVQRAWIEAENTIGGFAGRGCIPEGASFIDASNDGTGTKIILAALAEKFYGIGQDAVAMGAVDTYVSGSMPKYLLDTLDVAELRPELHIQIIESVIRGCIIAGCRLIGGETAELPDMFKYPWMVNLNVASIGFPTPELEYVPVKAGQRVYGWLSHGVASNGFSLIREIFKLKDDPSVVRRRLQKKWKGFAEQTLADVLLQPTPIWIREIEQERKRGVWFAGHAHITGGGMIDNFPRILPPELKAVIYRNAWKRPPIFSLIQQEGQVSDEDMDRTFNQGIMVGSIVSAIGKQPSTPLLIGVVETRKDNEPQVQFTGAYSDSQ